MKYSHKQSYKKAPRATLYQLLEMLPKAPTKNPKQPVKTCFAFSMREADEIFAGSGMRGEFFLLDCDSGRMIEVSY